MYPLQQQGLKYGRPSATEMAAALRMSTTAGKEATLEMPTSKEGMPTEKSRNAYTISGICPLSIVTSAAERLTAPARTLAVLCTLIFGLI